MKRELNPVGRWYLRRDTHEMFQVIDYDDRSGTIRIQAFDGTLDEIEEEGWRALSATPVEAPEDWTGPLDNAQIDDLDEFVSEVDAQAIEPFTEDREPWEELMSEEVLDTEGEPTDPEWRPYDRPWTTQPFEHSTGSRRALSPPGG